MSKYEGPSVWQDSMALMKLEGAREGIDWHIYAALYKADPRPLPEILTLRLRDYTVLIKKYQYWLDYMKETYKDADKS